MPFLDARIVVHQVVAEPVGSRLVAVGIVRAVLFVECFFVPVEGEKHFARIDVVDVSFLEVLECAVGINGIVGIILCPLVILGGPIGVLVLFTKIQERFGYQSVHVVPRFPVRPLLALRFRHFLRIACLCVYGKRC